MKHELAFTLVLIVACLLAYISVLIPAWNSFFDWASCVAGLALFVVIVAEDAAEHAEEAEECTSRN